MTSNYWLRKLPWFLVILAAGAGCDAEAAGAPTLQGVVEFDERAVAFDVGGRLREVRMRRGEVVAADGVIAAIDDSLERPQRAARVADVATARAQLALLHAGARPEEMRGAAVQIRALRESEAIVGRNLARQQGLASRGAAPSAPLDELHGQLAQLRGQREALEQRLAQMRHGARREEFAAAEARVAAATAGLEALDARLLHYTLHAPMGGVVLDVLADPGEIVSPGSPLATIGDLDHPYVDVFVPQGRLSEVQQGRSARVRVDGVTTSWNARVEHIAARTEFTPRFLFSERERPNLVVRVRVRIDDPEHRLHAGVPAFVTLSAAAR